MKTNLKQNIKSIILALVLMAGVGYVSAYSTWAPPTATAPGNNADTPLNVNGIGQIKSGPLTLGGLGILGDFKFLPASGTPPTAGQALTADGSDLAHGKVAWAILSGTVGGGCFPVSGLQHPSYNYWGNATATYPNGIIDCACPSDYTREGTGEVTVTDYGGGNGTDQRAIGIAYECIKN